MKFYLVRHGQTQWNIEGKIQGKTDIPLNETGRQQARQLAEAIFKIPAAAIYSSPLKRALETAQLAAELKHMEVRILPQLREVNFGLWEGKGWSEVEKAYPEDFHLWETHPAAGMPTGGERKEEVKRRSAEAVEQILAETDGDAVLVAHGGILVHVAGYILRNQPEKKEIIVRNASITTLEYSRETQVGRILTLNDTAHLGVQGQQATNKYC